MPPDDRAGEDAAGLRRTTHVSTHMRSSRRRVRSSRLVADTLLPPPPLLLPPLLLPLLPLLPLLLLMPLPLQQLGLRSSLRCSDRRSARRRQIAPDSGSRGQLQPERRDAAHRARQLRRVGAKVAQAVAASRRTAVPRQPRRDQLSRSRRLEACRASTR